MGFQRLRDSWEVWRRKINEEIGHGIVINAMNIIFDRSHSNLHANNVQTAIDELDLTKIGVNEVSRVGKTGLYADLINKPEFAEVATSGDYDDLINKPTIPSAQVQSDWSQSDSSEVDYIKNKPNLAAVATSGDYDDLVNKPTIPSAQVQSDWSQSDSSKVDYIKNKPNLAAVATSGDYDDLVNKPTIPSAQVQSNWSQSDSSKVDYIKNKPTLGTAASKNSTSSISSGNTKVAESGGVYTAIHTTTSPSLTLNNVASDAVYSFAVNGNVCQLIFEGNFTQAGTIQIGSLPSSYRPKHAVNFAVFGKNSFDTTTIANITTAGEISIYGANTTEKMFFNVTWLCA